MLGVVGKVKMLSHREHERGIQISLPIHATNATVLIHVKSHSQATAQLFLDVYVNLFISGFFPPLHFTFDLLTGIIFSSR